MAVVPLRGAHSPVLARAAPVRRMLDLVGRRYQGRQRTILSVVKRMQGFRNRHFYD